MPPPPSAVPGTALGLNFMKRTSSPMPRVRPDICACELRPPPLDVVEFELLEPTDARILRGTPPRMTTGKRGLGLLFEGSFFLLANSSTMVYFSRQWFFSYATSMYCCCPLTTLWLIRLSVSCMLILSGGSLVTCFGLLGSMPYVLRAWCTLYIF